MKDLFRFRLLLLVWPLLTAPLRAQAPDPEPDHGSAALHRDLLRLPTTASLLQVTAHPDDEDGALLTLLARGRGVRTGLVSLTRGEGGQNKIGTELFDELGMTRTEELLASAAYYGVSLSFTRAVDYGYSKTLSEALQKWRFAERDGGPVVEDLVRAIRRFRPEVLVARFSGTLRDGHAHHQASAILARKAFAEAGRPDAFPELRREGLLPWQPKKLYIGIVHANEQWAVSEDVGRFDPLLGLSYSQLAWEGLAHQRTQGVGQVRPDPGPRNVYYERIDGTPLADVGPDGKIANPFQEGPAKRENGFFDGLDETVPGIAKRLGKAGEPLAADLDLLESAAAEALRKFDAIRPEASAEPLARGLKLAREIRRHLDVLPIGPDARSEAASLLDRKIVEFQDALNDSLSLTILARVEPEKDPGSPFPGFRFAVETMRCAVAGESFPVSVTLVNRSPRAVRVAAAEVVAPPGWTVEAEAPLSSGDLGPAASARSVFRVHVDPHSPPTAPYWHRRDVEEPLYDVDDPRLTGDPRPTFPLTANIRYEFGGAEASISRTVITRTIDTLRGEIPRDLAVEPAVSIRARPPLAIVPLANAGGRAVPLDLELTNLATGKQDGNVEFAAPPGWEPPRPRPYSLAKEGDSQRIASSLEVPKGAKEGAYVLRVSAGPFEKTVDILEHPDIAPAYFLRPSLTKIELVDVTVPNDLTIGYVRGPEDSIPEFLQQLGIHVTFLSPEDLEKGDLSAFPTIVTGPRAYDVRDDLKRFHRRLMDYVEGGGRLVVQYNTSVRSFREFPFPATFSSETRRITVEDSPVEILHPDDPVWNFPNKITPRDFDGWVQERGLYFPDQWSSDYIPLVKMQDPGEAPLLGGTLEAHPGKGTYIYTALSWFRELPEGVPGAIRIFVNLISPKK
ncbi:MAG: PIG-L family deacetylase [Thermoanaerobaculia bacterium]